MGNIWYRNKQLLTFFDHEKIIYHRIGTIIIFSVKNCDISTRIRNIENLEKRTIFHRRLRCFCCQMPSLLNSEVTLAVVNLIDSKLIGHYVIDWRSISVEIKPLTDYGWLEIDILLTSIIVPWAELFYNELYLHQNRLEFLVFNILIKSIYLCLNRNNWFLFFLFNSVKRL